MNKVLTKTRSPFKLAWESTFGERTLNETKRAMRSLFNDRSLLDTFGFTDLHEAYLGVSSRSFGDLLVSSSRAVTDQVDAGQRSTLSWAAQRGDLETIQQLLSRGADPNKADRRGTTPLHWAAENGGYYSLKALLSAGADVNRKDGRGRTTLMYAVIVGDDVKPTKMLLDFGADIASKDDSGTTAIHIAGARDRPKVLTYFADMGGDINGDDQYGRAPFAYAILYQSYQSLKALLDHETFDCTHTSIRTQESILHFAVRQGDLASLKLLRFATLKGVNVEERDQYGRTALRIAQLCRDNNARWSEDEVQPPDEDPVKWYAAFVEILTSISDPGAETAFVQQVRVESAEGDDAESAERGQIESIEIEEDEITKNDENKRTKSDEESEDWQDASELPVP